MTFFNITGLGGNTTYTYFVRATNTAGNSGNTGRSFTTLLGPQTINLVATASNSLQSSSASSANANTSYPNTFPSVGVNTVCGGPFCDTLAFAGLVKYDTSPLVGKTIISATLTLEVNLAPVGFSRQNFDIGTVATPWNPLTITWNGAGSFLYYIDGWIYNNAFPLFSGQLYNFDITSIVQNWASGFFNNNGLILQSSNYLSSPGINSLDAYEFTVPTLTVTYQ